MGEFDQRQYWFNVGKFFGDAQHRGKFLPLWPWYNHDKLAESVSFATTLSVAGRERRVVVLASAVDTEDRLEQAVHACHAAAQAELADFGIVLVVYPFRRVENISHRLIPQVLLCHPLDHILGELEEAERWLPCPTCGDRHFSQMIAIVDPLGAWADHYEAVCPKCKAVNMWCCDEPVSLGVGESTERCKYCDRSFTNTGEAIEVTYHYDDLK
jgi:hypothetical protein